MRKIIHLDMDCFYAAVEMREQPDLVGKPIAVGGGSRRGVVCTANYEARKYGVRSAMPGFMAREKCPHLIFLPVRFDLYRAESQKIRRILREYTPLVEPLSLDEAYLDVSHSYRFAWDIAKEIRKRIFDETRLTASAGVAPNKMLAKIASDWRKPNGQFAIVPEKIESFMKELPVRKIWGVGPKSAERFETRGIRVCGDLQKLTVIQITEQFGKWGTELHSLCRGIDDRAVQPNRIRKSFSNERTFSNNLEGLPELTAALLEQVHELLTDLQAKADSLPIHKAVVKVKFSDFTQTTHECVAPEPTAETFLELFKQARARKGLSIRLLGVGVRFRIESNDEEEAVMDQLPLFAR